MRGLAFLLFFLGLVLTWVWLGTDGDTPKNGVRTAPPLPAPTPRDTSKDAPERAPEWTGSTTCAECHPDIHARWKKTAHALTLGGPEQAAKPFDGDVFWARDVEHVMGPGPQMTCEGPGGERQTFPVEMTIGVRRAQMFTTSFPGGRIQVLPVFLEVPKKKWFDYTDFIFGAPPEFRPEVDGPYAWYGAHRNFNSRCGRCHITNYSIGYDADTGTYDTTWTERAISCELCHDAGGAHVNYWRFPSAGADSNQPDPIVNPAKLSITRSNQVCGQCHAEGTMVKPGFRPGDNLFFFYDLAGLDDAKHLYPDGRASELIHNLLPNMTTRCGPISCSKCHDPHGSGRPGDTHRAVGDNKMCTQCHEDVKEHSHHKPDSAGRSCVACHMPRLLIEGGHGRVYDHTISIPSAATTRQWGTPNACRNCHMVEFPDWETPFLKKWYPGSDERNHRVALADAFGAARLKQPGWPALLIPYLKNPNPVYRAGAARVLEHSNVDLRPQLQDQHPLVQRAAVPGVARRHPEALVSFLKSENHVLRRTAALALVGHEPARADVVTALEDAIRARPDHAELYEALAQVTSGEKKTRALRRAKLLRPKR